MEDLKELGEVLEVWKSNGRRTFENHLGQAVVHRQALEGSFQFLGCQALKHSYRYVICTNEGLHLFNENLLESKHMFSSDCCAYLYMELGMLDVSGPLHATFMSDGVVDLYRIDDDSINLVKTFPVSRTLMATSTVLTAVESVGTIWVSFDSQRILRCGKEYDLQEIYNVGMGELLSFCFILGDLYLFCLCQHKSTGQLYIETARKKNRTQDHGYSPERSNGTPSCYSFKYATNRRLTLPTTNKDECYFISVEEHSLICVTTDYTYLVGGESLTSFKNLNGPNLQSSVNVDAKFEVESDQITITVFDGSGNSSEGRFSLSTNESQTITWNPVYILPAGIKRHELSYVAPLSSESLDSYLMVSKLSGVSVLNRASGWSVVLPGKQKKVFDGNCVPTDGSSLDSFLYCGAYTEDHGFIEKQTSSYQNDFLQVFSLKRLIQQPVENLWDTDCGLLYDSWGQLYHTETNKVISAFDDNCWLTWNNVTLDVSEERIVSISEVIEPGKGTVCCLSVILQDGILEVRDIRGNEHRKVLFALPLHVCDTQNAKSAAMYNESEKCYYIACFVAPGSLRFFRDLDQIQEVKLEMDCVLTGLTLKVVNEYMFVILTTVDGRAKVLSWKTGECLLDISVVYQSRVQLIDLGKRWPFVLLYSEYGCTLVNLVKMVYGKIDIGVRPVKIIGCRRDCCLFYVLDDRGYLSKLKLSDRCPDKVPSTVYKSDVYDLPDCIAIRLVPCSEPHLAVVVLQNRRKSQLKAILFDYNLMKIINEVFLSKWDSKCLNVVLRSFDDDDIPSETIRLRMRRTFLISCTTQNTSTAHFVGLKSRKLMHFAFKKMPFPALSVTSVNFGTSILFGGSRTKCYNSEYTTSQEEGFRDILLSPVETHWSELEGPLFYSCRGTTYMAISLSGNYSIFEHSSGRNIRPETAFDYKLGRVGSGSLVHVVTKRIPKGRSINTLKKSDETDKMPSDEVLKSLSSSFTIRPNNYYMLTVDYHGYVNIFSGIIEVPIGHFRLKSPILNVSPIAAQSDGLQMDNVNWRLQNTLFMITCADSCAYIVSVHTGPTELGYKVLENTIEVSLASSIVYSEII